MYNDSIMANNIWHQFEKLLHESVKKDHYFGVKRLLQYESVITASQDQSKVKCTLPLITAIENKNVCIINLLRKYDYKLPEPHVSECYCDRCLEDKFGQAKHRLLILKALANPIWISLVSEDPFLRIFQLDELIKRFATFNDCFHIEYNEMIEENQKLCIALLNEVRSQKEGATLMRYKTISQNGDCRDLSFINFALEYEQKEVVAHPVTQFFLTSAVFDEVPRWQTSGIFYKVFLIMMVGILYPVTTMLNIFIPSSYCWSIGDIAMKPFVKFINRAASFLTFLGILIFISTISRRGMRNGDGVGVIDGVVIAWLIGFCFGECRQVYKSGIISYFKDGWNWVDLSMDILMVFSVIVWIISERPISPQYETLIFVVDGTFTAAIILSFFRLLYLCQITSYLGLLQICLGQMLAVILQFAFIMIITLVSFSVGMLYLYNASQMREKDDEVNYNVTAIYRTFDNHYDGFFNSLFTMIYVSLTLEDLGGLDEFQDGTLIQLWANILFIIYFGITMVIVMNMLIAMMTNTYQLISDNISREHMYSRTKLWMEYIGDVEARPVPFNLIPSVKDLIWFVKYIYSRLYPPTTNENAILLREEEERKYRKLCHTLVKRYMSKTFSCANYAEAPNSDEECDDDDPLLQKIERHCKIWKQVLLHETSEDAQDTTMFVSSGVNDTVDSDDSDESCDKMFHAHSNLNEIRVVTTSAV